MWFNFGFSISSKCFLEAGEPKSDFHTFYEDMQKSVDDSYAYLDSLVDELAPRLLKIEEILFQSRSLKRSEMSQYYHHWEQKVYEIIVTLVKKNLLSYQEKLRGIDTGFVNQCDIVLQ